MIEFLGRLDLYLRGLHVPVYYLQDRPTLNASAVALCFEVQINDDEPVVAGQAPLTSATVLNN